MTANRPWYQGSALQAAALFLFACILYANTLGHGFALDDAIVITDNSVVQRGVAGWGDLFAHDSFYGFFDEEERDALVTGGRYRPLTLAMFSIEQAVDSGPFLHHLINVVSYGLLVVVTFAVLQQLGGPWWLAIGVAALFASHPLHTEVVANIKGRDEIVALLGALGAAYLLLRSARNDKFWGGVAGAGMFLLGCLAKENAITFVAVIPLLVYVFVRKGYRHLIPLLVAAVIYLIVRYSVVGLGGGEPPLEWMNNPFLRQVNGGWEPLTFVERLPTVLYTLLLYLKLLFFPIGLVHDYYPAAIELRGWDDPMVWISLIVHFALLAWSVLHLRSRHKIAAAGVLIYLMTLSLVSNIFFNVGTFMSERFLFMPSLGFALAVGGVLATATRMFRMLPWVLPVVIILFSGLTIQRNPVWKDNFTLFTTDVKRQPDSAKLRNAAGGARLDRYQSLELSQQSSHQYLVRDALTDLNEALRIHPTYRNAYLLRGNAQLLSENYAAAIADYERAAQLSTTDADVRNNLVIALQRAGRAAGEEHQDFAAALAYLGRADQLRPGDYETLRLLGIASGMSGKLPEAAEYFRRAVAIMPDNAGAVRNYGTALYQLGRTEEARVQFERAERLEN